jgi:hypothetical protein
MNEIIGRSTNSGAMTTVEESASIFGLLSNWEKVADGEIPSAVLVLYHLTCTENRTSYSLTRIFFKKIQKFFKRVLFRASL